MLKDGQKGVILQRDKETYAIAPHLPGGLVTPETLRKLADVAEKYNAAALKCTGAGRIAIVGLKEEDIDNVWADLDMPIGHAIGLCVRSVRFCPGTTFCTRGLQDSVGVGMKLDEKFHGMELPGKLKMAISGCPNNCVESPVRDIGLQGRGKGWRVMIGGACGPQPRFAETIVDDLDDETAIALVDKLIEYYKVNGKKLERFARMVDRIGLDAIKESVL